MSIDPLRAIGSFEDDLRIAGADGTSRVTRRRDADQGDDHRHEHPAGRHGEPEDGDHDRDASADGQLPPAAEAGVYEDTGRTVSAPIVPSLHVDRSA